MGVRCLGDRVRGTGVDPMVVVEPAALMAAAVALDEAALRLETAHRVHGPGIRPVPAALEEVSRLVSHTQGRIADSFDVAASSAVEQLRRAARTLRAQAGEYTAADLAHATGLTPG